MSAARDIAHAGRASADNHPAHDVGDHRPDPGIVAFLDLDDDDYRAADAVMVDAGAARAAGEAKAHAEFLDRIEDPVVQHVFTSDPAVASRLKQQLNGSDFCTTAADVENYGRAVAQTTLKAFGSIAGVVAGVKGGKASGASRRDNLAARDAIIRKLWARTDPNLKDAARARDVEAQLHRDHKALLAQLGLDREDITLSARQIRRIVKRAASPK
jgi:hypothetical protein